MSAVDFMKKPCKHCPFRHDVKPFLTNERAEELSYATHNPYNTFPCHKTTEESENSEGEMMCVATTKECAGFLTLRANELGEEEVYEIREEGFKPAYDVVYGSAEDMIYAYEDSNTRG